MSSIVLGTCVDEPVELVTVVPGNIVVCILVVYKFGLDARQTELLDAETLN